MKRSAFVLAWLQAIRDREPTITQSVTEWQKRFEVDQVALGKTWTNGKPKRSVKKRKGPPPMASNEGLVRIPMTQVQVSVRKPYSLDRRKQSLYFGEDMLSEMRFEAERQGRPISWLLQRAWRYSAEQIRNFPAPHLELR